MSGPWSPDVGISSYVFYLVVIEDFNDMTRVLIFQTLILLFPCGIVQLDVIGEISVIWTYILQIILIFK